MGVADHRARPNDVVLPGETERMLMTISPQLTWALLGLPAARLPVALIILFGALGLAALLYLHQRGRRLQAGVDEQFKRFREEAVGLMDQIDALRQRHKSLPESDPDFTVPMAGATLALYNQISSDLDRLWEQWLKVMEVWNQAEQRMRSASTFSAGPTEEARELLESGGIEDLLRRSSACKEELDRLNLAHETAAKALKEARMAIAEAERSPSGGARFHEAAERARRDLGEAEAMITADPIGAADRIETARRALDGLREETQPPPRQRRPHVAPGAPSRTVFDDLFTAAGHLQELAANLRVTDIVSLLIKGWVALWVLGLMLVFLPLLMPLILVFMGFVVIASGLRAFQHMSGPVDWGDPRQRRRRRW